MTLKRIGDRAGLVVWECDCQASFITSAKQFTPKFCPYCRGAAGEAV